MSSIVGRYPPEIREELVRLVKAGRTPASLAQDFAPSEQTIRNWVRQADLDEGRRAGGLKTEVREELLRLRRNNERLRMEREILKRAAAWFACEDSREAKPIGCVVEELESRGIGSDS